jgi:hypothetical protein
MPMSRNLSTSPKATPTTNVDSRTAREKVTLEDLLLLDCLGEKKFDAHKKRMRKAKNDSKRAKP